MHTIESMSVEFGVSVETIRAIVSRVNSNKVNEGYNSHFKTDYTTRKISAFTTALIVRGDIDYETQKTTEFKWCLNQIVIRDRNRIIGGPHKQIYNILCRLSDCIGNGVSERRKTGKRLIMDNINIIAAFIDERTKHKPLNGGDMGTVFYLSAENGKAQLMLGRTVVRSFLRTLRSIDDYRLTRLWSTDADGNFIYGAKK